MKSLLINHLYSATDISP